jgi:hypothetical protein
MGKSDHDAALRPWNRVPALAAGANRRACRPSDPPTVRFVRKNLFFSINIALLSRVFFWVMV